jgi:tRNA pseudouridine65 synthase
MAQLKPEILALGHGWIAINKPAGMSVHNDADGSDAIQIVRVWLESSDPEAQKAVSTTGWEKAKFPPAPVHRLDRETSGILILATRRDEAARLQQAMEKRESKKIYRAILRGRLRDERGTWHWPLSDKAEGRMNPQGKAADRKECETRFHVVRANDHLSEIEIELITGRQHQIRRHAALAKHAIVGDKRYGDARHTNLIARLFGVERMLLHAASLEIYIGDKKHLQVEAPLPLDFLKVFETPAAASSAQNTLEKTEGRDDKK